MINYFIRFGRTGEGPLLMDTYEKNRGGYNTFHVEAVARGNPNAFRPPSRHVSHPGYLRDIFNIKVNIIFFNYRFFIFYKMSIKI